MPSDVALPPIWLLGSSGYSAQLAGMVGAGFSFAHHFSDYDAVAAMLSYREHFRPSQARDKPYAMLGGRGGVRRQRRGSGPAGDHARSQLGAPRARRICCRSQVRKRRRIFPTRRSISNASATAARGCSPARRRRSLAQLTPLIEATKADELMVTTMIYDHAARRHSYELLAQAFGLAGQAVSAAH